jgi:hypothetical protein
MAWDPVVLKKYNATGHFRLLSQLRSELRGNPLVRPQEGETIGEVNRSRFLVRTMEAKAAAAGSGTGRGGRRSGSTRETQGRNRGSQAVQSQPLDSAVLEDRGLDRDEEQNLFVAVPVILDDDTSENASFRDRLNAVELR